MTDINALLAAVAERLPQDDPDKCAQTLARMSQPKRPYTDADLRAEAARQHHALTSTVDEMFVGEDMERSWVPSVETTEDGSGRTWADLLNPEGDDTAENRAAQESVHHLITRAANVSEWAVALGVAGLTPHPPIAIRCTTTGWEVAVQIATAPDTTDEARDELLRELRTAITETTARVLGLKPA